MAQKISYSTTEQLNELIKIVHMKLNMQMEILKKKLLTVKLFTSSVKVRLNK